MDYAATTPVAPKVFSAMKPYFLSKYGNPSEFHKFGEEARRAVEESRMKVAAFLGAQRQEIIFTGSASESINLSHKGLIEALIKANQTPHIITSTIEHKAVLESCKHLENSGQATVTYLPVDKNGLISLSDLETTITPQTVLVSIMYVNNEIGTIQPITGIGKLLKKVNKKRETPVYFHTDATQALAYLDCQVDNLGVDLLSFTGHKLSAPKGVGGLYIRSKTPLVRQLDGGSQEGRLRAGTENVPYIVGLGKAIELLAQEKETENKKLTSLQVKLINEVLKIPSIQLTGHPTQRAPHIVSFVVENAEGEAMVLGLSDKGIAVSSGSACTSDRLSPSHVLTAIGVPAEKSHGSLRVSLGKFTTGEEVDYLLQVLPEVIQKLRAMAPQFKLEDFQFGHHGQHL